MNFLIVIHLDHRRIATSVVVVGELVSFVEPESYVGWSLASGRVTHARQVKGEGPDEERSTSPLGLGVGHRVNDPVP